MSQRKIRALVFDAYGTLFDLGSLTQMCVSLWPERGQALSELWRRKQLEYSWLRTMMGRYADFEQITGEALFYAVQFYKVQCDASAQAKLVSAYRELKPFAEASTALENLKPLPLGVLSNGSPAMLESMIDPAGLPLSFVLSADLAKTYKVAPSVYQLALEKVRALERAKAHELKDAEIAPAEIGFVTANGWDALGAKNFGFRVFWVNRAGLPREASELGPDFEIANLGEIAAHLS